MLYFSHHNSTSSSRNEVTLKQRVEVVEYHKKIPACRSWKLANLFECGRTQILQILESSPQEACPNMTASDKFHGTCMDLHSPSIDHACYISVESF